MATDEPRVAVVIPWRATTERLRAFRSVWGWYMRTLPDVRIVIADSACARWNAAAARNEGVRRAEGIGANLVVLADADTIPLEPNLRAAIEGAFSDGLLHLPYDAYVRVKPNAVDLIDRGIYPPPAMRGPRIRSAASGACVLTVDAYWASGGQDERFEGWGGEDSSWICAVETLVGPVQRHPGRVFSIDHDRSSQEWPNEFTPLFKRYWAARGDKAAMLSLISERG